MEQALAWWSKLPRHRKKLLADYHHWTTPEQISNEIILDIYYKEAY